MSAMYRKLPLLLTAHNELLGRMEKRRSKLADKVTKHTRAEDAVKEIATRPEPSR
jgi:hypothetical protein